MDTGQVAGRITGARRMGVYFAAAALAAAAGGLGMALFRDSLPIVIVLYALVMLVVLGASVWWWRGVDEAVQEAHKAAWFWGGLTSVAVAAPLLIAAEALSEAELARWALGEAPLDLIITGVFACMLVQLVGYSIAWALWWLKRR